MEEINALELKNISKYFGTVAANEGISFSLKRGEILALLGENGSGKTTLMNMISGIYYPDEGQILVNGQEVVIRSPKDAFAHQIGMVHQHFKLIDIFTAAQNIVLGVERRSIRGINEEVKEIAERYGFDLDPKKKIYDMSVSEKQTVEIVKVLYRGADILILDEPTAVLTPQETEKLFSIMRAMKENGKSIIIITHKLHEVMEISDRVAVLRKGRYIGCVNTAESSEMELTEMMVGQKVTLNIERPETKFDRPLLEIRDLCIKNDMGSRAIEDLSFFIRGGEILGVAGIAGCGQRELCEAIAGLRKVESGGIYHEGESIVGLSPKEITHKGIAMSFIPEDRLGMGLAPSLSITDNMMLKNYQDRMPAAEESGESAEAPDADLAVQTEEPGAAPVAQKKNGCKVFLRRAGDRIGRFLNRYCGFVDRKRARQQAEQIIQELDIVTPSTETPVRRLSGGNLQKVLLGREILIQPNVLITAYPVRGLDINSSYLIYDILNREKKGGTGILFIGEDLDVMLALCDKIMVLCQGRLMGVVHAEKTNKEELGLMMAGSLNLMEEKGKQMGIAKDTQIGGDASWNE